MENHIKKNSESKRIIGISSYARSGKDTMCQSLINVLSEQGLRAKRFALADILKQEIKPFILKNFGIDVETCDGGDKETVRGLMIEYGFAKRKQSDGLYFTEALKRVMDLSKFDIGIVTDLRYHQYNRDEIYWLKNVIGGKLVSLALLDENCQEIKSDIPDELAQIPLIRAEMDQYYSWGKTKSKEKIDDHAKTLLKLLNYPEFL
jgi:hypothetical protein